METLSVSESERLLIETIRDVQYGELFGVRVTQQGPKETMRLREGNAQLIRFLRENGYIELPKVTIHNGEVKQVEVVGNKNGIRYRKKIRF